MNDAVELLTRGCVDVVSKEELAKKLASGKNLRVKLGADPTSADLHLGHSVVLYKLRAFQDLGHTAVLVIGDFTASVGDPSGRNSTRPMLSKEDILLNAQTYTQQVFKILDPVRTEIKFNGSWLEPFVSSRDFLRTLSKITVSQALEREDFKKRMQSAEPVSVLEILYSVFQGYDSVALQADVELGGTDQIFNLLMGRQMQKLNEQEPQVVMTVPLLIGTDGVKKMSKSYGNYIGINEPAAEIFGKAMSVSDELMYSYYELLTRENMAEIKAMHPMEAKKKLAFILAERLHDESSARAAKENFETLFSKKDMSAEMADFKPDVGVLISGALLALGVVKSKNEARRMIDQGGVKLNGVKLPADGALEFKEGDVFQAGKKTFVRLKK